MLFRKASNLYWRGFFFIVSVCVCVICPGDIFLERKKKLKQSLLQILHCCSLQMYPINTDSIALLTEKKKRKVGCWSSHSVMDTVLLLKYLFFECLLCSTKC